MPSTTTPPTLAAMAKMSIDVIKLASRITRVSATAAKAITIAMRISAVFQFE